MDLDKLEEKLRNYAKNWMTVKLEILPTDVVELLDERDTKIRVLENKLRMIQNKDK